MHYFVMYLFDQVLLLPQTSRQNPPLSDYMNLQFEQKLPGSLPFAPPGLLLPQLVLVEEAVLLVLRLLQLVLVAEAVPLVLVAEALLPLVVAVAVAAVAQHPVNSQLMHPPAPWSL
jgi:hypothetical protein